MRYSAVSTIALATAAIASPVAQGKSPSSSTPAGCSSSYSGKFQIQVVNVTQTPSKRDIEKRQDGKLEIQLSNGVLTDEQGRIGNIVANHQFQFDPAPGQAGAIYTSGWSACSNGSIAIGGNAIFYECLSGNFYNLYDEKSGAQCYAVYVNIVGAGGNAGAQSDGQVTATSAAQVTQSSDGQVEATSAASAGQISDGQIQISKSASTSAAPVSQISDGQIQVSTSAKPLPTSSSAAPVGQISDGQIQVSTSAKPTGPVVTQIGDGQLQAPTNGTKPSGTGAGSAAKPTGSPIAYTGAASAVSAASAGMLALFCLALAL